MQKPGSCVFHQTCASLRGMDSVGVRPSLIAYECWFRIDERNSSNESSGMAHSESYAAAEAPGIYICIWIYMLRNRMAKTIAISDEVYELLKKTRLPGESFSVTIRRNLKKNKLADIIGSGTISLDDWREARARLLSAETRTSEKLTGRS